MTREIAIVGAGIAGCTIAWELARAGATVTLFDQGPVAGGMSGRNTGTLLQQVEPEVVELLRDSVAAYRDVEGVLDFELVEHGQLLLARDEGALAATRARAEAMAALGLAVSELAADDLRAVLREGLGGYAVAGAFTLDPEAATRAFAEAARAEGAEIVTGVRVGGVVANGRVQGLVTDRGRIGVDAAVLATGPVLRELCPAAATAPGRGWLLRTGPLPFRFPWLVEEMTWPTQAELGRVTRPLPLEAVAAGGHDEPSVEAFVVAPQPDGGIVLGASLAPSLGDALEGLDAPARIARRALDVCPALRAAPVLRAWSGLRPMTPDGLPLAGRGGVEGLWIHGGHGSLGMQSAPATARWLAPAMLGLPSPPGLAGLAPDRFERS